MSFLPPTFTLYPNVLSLPAAHQQDAAVNSAGKKVVDPFDPEATVPMPFQLDDNFGPFSTSVWKRNERERFRVRCVNDGYEKLRRSLPISDGDKRISKVDTLRLAIRYIKHLDAVLKNEQHIYRCRCFHGFKEESEGNIQVDMSMKNTNRPM